MAENSTNLPKNRGISIPRPAVKASSAYNSDMEGIFHSVSFKLFDKLAKLKISFDNNRNGEILSPYVYLNLRNLLFIDYDVKARDASVRGSFEVGKSVEVETYHDLREKKGLVTMTTALAHPSYRLALTSAVPSFGLACATLMFPGNFVSIEEKQNEQGQKALSTYGILRRKALGGLCSAQFTCEDLKANESYRNLKLRYSFKDEQMTFIPEIVLPKNAVSVTLRRKFGPSDKISYCYHFHSNDFSAVYKKILGEDMKLRVGYDSEVRLGWASLWVGEMSRTKSLPMKMKVQLEVKIPRDEILNPRFKFWVKKRWF